MKDKTRSLNELTDEELMLEYKFGSSDAFSILYGRHAPRIYGYLSQKLYAKNQVDDVFQDSFLKLHKFRDRYDASFPFLPWFFTICRNVMIDHLRKAARDRRMESQITFDQDKKESVLPDMSDISRHLESLSQKEAGVVGLHYLQGYSFEEVASHLNIKPAGARKISSRAIQKLKAIWKSSV